MHSRLVKGSNLGRGGRSRYRSSVGFAALVITVLLACVRLARFPGPPPLFLSKKETVTVKQELGTVAAMHALCGNVQIETVAQHIPSSMIYFQRRWNYTKQDWALAVTWLKRELQQVSSSQLIHT